MLDLEDSADPINLATLTPIDPATPLPWAPTLADLEFIRETRERIPELIEEAVAEGDYTGPAGRGIESVTGMDGTATVTYTDGTTASFPLPHGDDGDPGRSAYQLAVAEGFEGTLTDWLSSLHGADGPAPEVEWDGPVLVVGGERSPDLTGPPGEGGALYDSKWRNITGEVAEITNGQVYVRRIGPEVRMAFVGVLVSTTTGTVRNWWTVPNGFRWTHSTLNDTIGRSGAAQGVRMTVDAVGATEVRVNVLNTDQSGTGEVSWITDQAPPADNNLPGTN